MKIGLRIDVDTFRGTRDGVPNLCRLLAQREIRATFFFSMGPDNMGRHLWRLFKPAFLAKMLRSRAAKLYGWDILLRGTFWPGPVIGKRLGNAIRAAVADGHENGLHCWDHHHWQAGIERMDAEAVRIDIARAFQMLSDVAGTPPICSAAPGWKCTDPALIAKQTFPFRFNSDCRGHSIFTPVVNARRLNQPQVPVTLPTYDEIAGRLGGEKSFGDLILSSLQPDGLNVLTIHAEAEGIAIQKEFSDFLDKSKALGHEFCPLGDLVQDRDEIPLGMMAPGPLPGREGWVSLQKGIS